MNHNLNAKNLLPSSGKDAGLSDERRFFSRRWLLRNSLMDSSSDSVGDILSAWASIREGRSPATGPPSSGRASARSSINLTRI